MAVEDGDGECGGTAMSLAQDRLMVKVMATTRALLITRMNQGPLQLLSPDPKHVQSQSRRLLNSARNSTSHVSH